MRFYAILLILIIGCYCRIELVKTIQCRDENDCSIKFKNHLKNQKRIFATANNEKKNIDFDISLLSSEGKREDSFYYNLDFEKAPGFGMAILYDPEIEKDKDKMYTGNIYSITKNDIDHSEKLLLEELFFDLSLENDLKDKKTPGESDITKEIEQLKQLEGFIFIYINNSPCITCTSRYANILKMMKLKLHIYYTNIFKMTNLPEIEKETEEIKKISIFVDCFSDNSKNNSRKKAKQEEITPKTISKEKKKMIIECINERAKFFYRDISSQMEFSQINLNTNYVPRLRAIQSLLQNKIN